jgi:DNA repair protein RAD5
VPALSLVRGTRVANAGETVQIVRSHSTTPAKKTFGRKQKAHSNAGAIVRITKSNGSQIAKLDAETCLFVSTLLELEIVELKATIIYIPDKIQVATELLVSLAVSFKTEAFDSVQSEESATSATQVGDRKRALSLLFERTGLLHKQEVRLLKSMSESGELNHNDLATIYGKASQSDQRLEPMQPDDRMKLTLRHYQAVGLSFMHSKEADTKKNAKNISPLWKEFKSQNEETFYYCPYSGELSRKFPQEKHCAGGKNF